MTIGRGRIYVDGLLAENHGKAPLEFDPVLAERRGTLPMPYNEQPYFPNVNAVAPAPTTGGPHLVYLDVWQREVTFLEDLNLIEKAVGVDTTTRLQTVWQVKILANVGSGASCGSPLEAWNNLIAPSDGRLSSAAVGVPPTPIPVCCRQAAAIAVWKIACTGSRFTMAARAARRRLNGRGTTPRWPRP